MFMLEKALVGSRRYWAWIFALIAVMAAGAAAYLRQLDAGLVLTGLGRDVTWGLYIAQFTFLVGVAASAVTVVLPYYLHDVRAFGPIAILGEFIAIASVIACMSFVVVDMGQPMRVLNMLRYPSPGSLMFWDLLALAGYLAINVVITRAVLTAERQAIDPPRWIRPVIVLSIPWAVSIHTVTAFLYNGLPGRSLWLTSLLAPRFLASAFAAGPALLILLCLLMARLRWFDVGAGPLQKLTNVVSYAMLANVFFLLLELFTALYSGIPDDRAHFAYLYVGLDGQAPLAPWMWSSALLAALSLGILLALRRPLKHGVLAAACAMVIVSIWIEKGLGLIVGGLVPSPLGELPRYAPAFNEILITVGIWAFGCLLVTLFFRITSMVRAESAR